MNGAKVLLETLIKHNVTDVFGYPGGAVIPLYHEFENYMDRINHIRTSHEQAAVHAADGYARATGKTGVCFVTSGPGATNTITGIATAYMDSVPLVVITGQVPSALLGKDSFQEIDITGITMSITKHNFLVRNVDELQETLEEAFEIASSGRPGPVLVDIPKDLFVKACEYTESNTLFTNEEDDEKIADKAHLDEAIKMIENAKNPVIYAGGGIILGRCEDEFREFVKKTNIPVLNTLMGLGTIPREDELSLGMVGMHGSRQANLSVVNCDLLIAIGARFSDRVIGNPNSFAKNAKILHIDIDKTEINKNINVDLFLLGSVKKTLATLTKSLNELSFKDWLEEIKTYKTIKETNTDYLNADSIFDILNNHYKGDCVVATDVGQHQMWTAQKFLFNDTRKLLTSGGLGTMGYGLGAAIGAKVGMKDKKVVLVTGDGSFRMNMNELATLADYGLGIDIILIKNNTLGMVRQWQKLFNNKVYAQTDIKDNIDFVKLGAAFGIRAYDITTTNQMKVALNTSKSDNKSNLFVIHIPNNEDVSPIVPPGESIENLIEL